MSKFEIYSHKRTIINYFDVNQSHHQHRLLLRKGTLRPTPRLHPSLRSTQHPWNQIIIEKNTNRRTHQPKTHQSISSQQQKVVWRLKFRSGRRWQQHPQWNVNWKLDREWRGQSHGPRTAERNGKCTANAWLIGSRRIRRIG